MSRTLKRNKFSGQTCIYCGAEAETSDHVVARKFFLVERRDNLPQVPACWNCNNRKSQLEAYLLTVLPFGAKHPDAAKNLLTLVPPRLEKNAKLRRKLEMGFAKSGGTAVPLDHKPLEEFLAMVAKALAWQHWGVRMGEGFSAIASVFHNDGEQFFRHLFSRGSERVTGELGNGTFTYEGTQTKDCPELTVWRFWLYGGIDFSDPRMPGPSSLAVAVTGPSIMIGNLRYKGVFSDPNPPKVGRNEPCPCGSGKKHKKCHGSVTAKP